MFPLERGRNQGNLPGASVEAWANSQRENVNVVFTGAWRAGESGDIQETDGEKLQMQANCEWEVKLQMGRRDADRDR